MSKLELNVYGMSCSHCSNAVINALKDLGATEVNVDLSANKVVVEYDENVVSADAIKKEIVNELGYEIR